MGAKADHYNLWRHFVAKNDETYFHKFTAKFVETWVHELDLNIKTYPSKPLTGIEGPHLSKLPDELLPLLGKFLYLKKEAAVKRELSTEEITQVNLFLKTLLVISRNFDNIPFILSLNFIEDCCSFGLCILKKLSQGEDELEKELLEETFSNICFFLECMYDPYMCWRSFVESNHYNHDKENFKPAFLSKEILDFLHNCLSNLNENGQLSCYIVSIIGSIILGAHHNACQILSIAIIDQLILGLDQCELPSVKFKLMACNLAAMKRMLISSPEERSAEMILIIKKIQIGLIALSRSTIYEDNYSIKFCLLTLSKLIHSYKEVSYYLEKSGFLVCLSNVICNIWKCEPDNTELQVLSIQLVILIVGNIPKKYEASDLSCSFLWNFLQSVQHTISYRKEVLCAILCLSTCNSSEEAGNMIYFAEPIRFLIENLSRCDLIGQHWILENISALCQRKFRNKLFLSLNGIIRNIIDCLRQRSIFSPTCIQNLFNLIEIIGSASISSTEVFSLLQLIHPKHGMDSNMNYLLHTLCCLSKARGFKKVFHFIDVYSNEDGYTLPNEIKWNNSGQGYTFVASVRLDKVEDDKVSRRQLYSFYSSPSNGFEAFFNNQGILSICIGTKKEYHCYSLHDFPFRDNCWYVITITHSLPRKPFGQSLVNVYVDGHMKGSACLKYPVPNDISRSHIGVASDGTKSCRPSIAVSGYRSIWPNIYNLVPNYATFSNTLKLSSAQDDKIKVYPQGSQESILGPASCLFGQIGSVALFQDVISVTTIKEYFFSEDALKNLLSYYEGFDIHVEVCFKSTLMFCPQSIYEGFCPDLSIQKLQSCWTQSQVWKTSGFQEANNCIAGIQLYFVLIECFQSDKLPDSGKSRFLTSELSVAAYESPKVCEELTDWEVLPSMNYSDWKIARNPVAAILTLIGTCISNSLIDQSLFKSKLGISILGTLLTQVYCGYIDVSLLMSIQLLYEHSKDLEDQDIKHLVYHHLLMNFGIWTKCQFLIRLGHLQYLSTVINENQRYFRKHFGVQFLLDVITEYYCMDEFDTLCRNDHQAVRQAIFNLIKQQIAGDVNRTETISILNFLLNTGNDDVLSECLDMLISVLESNSGMVKIYQVLFQQNQAELLYCLILDNYLSVVSKEKVCQLLYLILRSDRVSDKSKTRLRLHDIGLSGLLACMDLSDCHLMKVLALPLLNIALETECLLSYDATLSLMYYCHDLDVHTKVRLVKTLLGSLFMHPMSANYIVRQTAWQESLGRLLIKRKLEAADTHNPDLANIPDLINFHEEYESHKLDDTNVLSFAENTNVSQQIGDGLRGVAETVSHVRYAVADNILSVQDNITNVVASAYSSIKQKTLLMQESLEEWEDVVVTKLKRASLMPTTGHVNNILSTPEELTVSSEDVPNSDCHPNFVSTDESIFNLSGDKCTQHVTEGNDNEEEFSIVLSQSALDSLSVDTDSDSEQELIALMIQLYLYIMVKGIEGSNKDSWKERGQVLASINILALNNELYLSHIEFKRRLVESMLEFCANLSRTRKPKGQSSFTQENVHEVLLWAHDLICLDPFWDLSKKFSLKLLENIIAVCDNMKIIEEAIDESHPTIIAIILDMLLCLCSSPDEEIHAMASAKLHTVIHTRDSSSVEESSYVLFRLTALLNHCEADGKIEQLSFLIPIIKGLLTVHAGCLDTMNSLVSMPDNLSTDEFLVYIQGTEWKCFVQNKVSPLHMRYKDLYLNRRSDLMNLFWTECYECSIIAIHRRNKEWTESRASFEDNIVESRRARVCEEKSRFSQWLACQRAHQEFAMKQWMRTKRFHCGPRGPWACTDFVDMRWKLSTHENSLRMRLKMVPNDQFDSHSKASRLRDNQGHLMKQNNDSLRDGNMRIAREALRQDASEDSLSDEDVRSSVLINEIISDKDVTKGDKLILNEECQLVTLMSVIKGRLEVTNSCIIFYDLSTYREDRDRHDFRISLSKLREIHLRRYNLRRSAVEVFLIDQSNYFLNFSTKTRNKVFSRIVNMHPPNLIYNSSRSPAELLRSSGLTQKWVNRQISNFEYLMQLNTIAGRTYNDLSQYPVFPWVLADYESEVLDLESPSTFRDLSKPIGVVNPKNEVEVKAKYEHFEDPCGIIAKFHYGTHYSNSAGVLHYLVRMEPFTTLHIELQSGRFDLADRQFHSIPGTWKLLMENPNDVKELIPEFFYLPEFLVNSNKFDLGKLQESKAAIDDVILPKWARSPEDFINKHRRALESEHVSSHLHEWIDLIFGYKQKGVHAEKSLNVFYYCSYEGAVDLDAIKDPVEREATEGMINNFGQTPSQLLKDPHPRRMSYGETMSKLNKAETPPPQLFISPQFLKSFYVEISTSEDPVIFVGAATYIPKSSAHGNMDNMISITSKGIIGCHGWLPYDKYIPSGFTLDIDKSMNLTRNKKKLCGTLPETIHLCSQMFAVSRDCRVIFYGGNWDYSLRLFNVTRNRLIQKITRHFDLVTCVALDTCETYLVTGSKDKTICVWELNTSAGHILGVGNKPIQVLFGHSDEVTSVSVSGELNLVVSASKDGKLNLHSVKEGIYLQTLSPPHLSPGGSIELLTLSCYGHLCVYSKDENREFVDVFSVNGKHLHTWSPSNTIQAIEAVGEFLVTGDIEGNLEIREIHGLVPVNSLNLSSPIQSVTMVTGRTHMMVPLRDGKLIVIGLQQPTDTTRL